MKKKRKPLLEPLTDEERNIILPKLILLFKTKTHESKHLTSKVICDKFNEKKDLIGFKCAFNNARFMKLTNYIRAQEILPLVSCRTGYYVCDDMDVVEDCGDSLMSRIDAIKAAADGMYNMAKQMRIDKEMKQTCALGFTWD